MNKSLKEIALQEAGEVLSAFQTDASNGLTQSEADKRLQQYGLNIIPRIKKWQYGKNCCNILKAR
jgi:Cation transport ATPase